MYRNLEAEMARNNIKLQELADGIGINISTASAKMNIQNRFRLDESKRIIEKFFPDLTMDYLFEWTD